LSDLEKVGLVALGALVVGAIINEGKKDQRKVVSNTGDRVVVQNPDGSYQVYKDDDAVIRRPGSTVRTETYKDGSSWNAWTAPRLSRSGMRRAGCCVGRNMTALAASWC